MERTESVLRGGAGLEGWDLHCRLLKKRGLRGGALAGMERRLV